MRYSIFDPSGNITALAENPATMTSQSTIAGEIMKKHPEIEQVGFVRFSNSQEEPFDVCLQMAGGEFCGNASMCAATLYIMKSSIPDHYEKYHTVRLQVSGVSHPLSVTVQQQSPAFFKTGITMPQSKDIRKIDLSFGNIREKLPVVMMQGITHIITTPESAFFDLKNNKKTAEQVVRNWCKDLSAEACGLLFLETASTYKLTPLVYVPGSETLFWENSCASGSAAVGMYMAAESGNNDLNIIQEPGGTHSVISHYPDGETMLFGNVRLISQFILDIPNDFRFPEG